MGDFVNNLFSGGHYELSIQYATLTQGIEALKGVHKLPMFHRKNNMTLLDNNLQPLVESWPTTLQIDEHAFSCLISFIHSNDHHIFIDFAIPLNELEKVYPLKYPLERAQNEWLTYIHDVFLNIAERLYDDVPFLIAVMGEEVSGSFDAKALTVDDVERLHCVLPTAAQVSLQVHHEGLPISTKLALY